MTTPRNSQETNIDVRLRQFKTDIIGLDDLLRGGFVLPPNNNADIENGLVILIKGKPGTGKTTFALQLLYHLTQEVLNKCKSTGGFRSKLIDSTYFSIEQSQEELEDKLIDLVISQIFDELGNLVAGNLKNLTKEDSDKILHRIQVLNGLFDKVPLFNAIKSKSIKLTDQRYKHLQIFFKYFKYNRLKNAIVPVDCFQIGSNFYNILSGYLISTKIFQAPHSEDKIKKVFYCGNKIKDAKQLDEIIDEILLIDPNFKVTGYENKSIDDIKKQFSYEKRPLKEANSVFSQKEESYGDFINRFKDRLESIKTTEKDKNKKLYNQLSNILETFQKELQKTKETNIKSNEYDSVHLVKNFNIIIKTSESIKSNVDSPYNFTSAQIVHNFINTIIDPGSSNSNEKTIYPCLVLDGLNILSEKEKKLINIGKIVRTLKNKSLFSILIYDGESDGSIYQDYYADLVVNLKGEVEKDSVDYFLHQIQIEKSRFQQAVLGWHQYKIRDFGLHIYPSVHYHVHINNYQTQQILDSFSPAIDQSNFDPTPRRGNSNPSNIDRILIHPERGSFTAIFGARATFKTSLTLNFLYNAARQDEGDSLLLSLVDNFGTLKDTCYCPKAKVLTDEGKHFYDCKKCHEQFFIFHQRTGCVAIQEFFYNLDKSVSEHKNKTGRKISRLAFWDLTQLEYRFPLLSKDPMFLPGMVEYTKKNNIALIVMGAGNSRFTPAASAIADNVIFCWRSRLAEEKNHQEVLAVYVDRCQGNLGNEGKQLSYIPIKDDKIDLNCCNSGNESVGFTRVEPNNNDIILGAQSMIDTITNMQGMGSVTNK